MNVLRHSASQKQKEEERSEGETGTVLVRITEKEAQKRQRIRQARGEDSAAPIMSLPRSKASSEQELLRRT